MTAKILDGRVIAGEIEQEIRIEVERLEKAGQSRPGLAVIVVGNNPASRAYVRGKSRASALAGFRWELLELSAGTSTEELLRQLARLNEDPQTHGIVVQLPLPRHLDTQRILAAIQPSKDVDGLTQLNAGLLALGMPLITPATPTGVLELLRRAGIRIAGQHAVVVGRSNLVGKPLALLLLQEDATVTICHSKTANLSQLTRLGDIVVVATGQPGFLKGAMIKPGAVVIDIGTTRVDGRLRGDVDRASVEPVAGYLSPVPGGVGPLTVAMLLRNTLEAAKRQLPR
jgi:methylenetetrahydrofolate dehydrogenase (NADP+)/methenyltetrahydrofolate cyclohydrolase